MTVMVMFFSVAAAFMAEGFQRVGEHSGVTVYRLPCQAIALGAEGDIAAPPAVVQRVLLDYPTHPRWVHNLRESRVLQRSEANLDVYQRLDLPFIDDRDYTLHVTWGQDTSGALWLRFAAANDRGPAPQHGVIRVPVHEGQWELTPIDGGRGTHAVYRFRLDLGGSLPGWMARGRASKDVPALFDAIRKQAAQLH